VLARLDELAAELGLTRSECGAFIIGKYSASMLKELRFHDDVAAAMGKESVALAAAQKNAADNE